MRNITYLIISCFLFSCSPVKNIQFVMTDKYLFENNNYSIIGGKDISSTDSLSHSVVGIYDTKTRFICTGSIIDQNIILTAAHCIESLPEKLIIIFGLDFSVFDLNQKNFLRTAQKVKIHPKFSGDPKTDLDWNDIALIQFSGGLPDGFKPIEFLEKNVQLNQGMSVQMAGFGANQVELEDVQYQKGRQFQKDLDAGEIICYDKTYSHCFIVHFLGTDRLRSTEAAIEGFTDKEIRLNEAKGHGTCVGDSGGPLLFKTENQYKLIGITSRGSQFCDGPAVYTNALEYLDWIKQTISEM